MNTTITTDRLILRQMTPDDFSDYLEYAQDPEVMAHIREVEPAEVIREHFNGYAEPWAGEESKWMGCAIELIETGKVIGDMGFRYRDRESEIIELGYKFNKRYHGCGYGFEALQAFAGHIRNHWPVHKFVGYADPENIASTRLMEKLGMVKEGHFKSHYKVGDHWTDEVAYGVVL